MPIGEFGFLGSFTSPFFAPQTQIGSGTLSLEQVNQMRALSGLPPMSQQEYDAQAAMTLSQQGTSGYGSTAPAQEEMVWIDVPEQGLVQVPRSSLLPYDPSTQGAETQWASAPAPSYNVELRSVDPTNLDLGQNYFLVDNDGNLAPIDQGAGFSSAEAATARMSKKLSKADFFAYATHSGSSAQDGMLMWQEYLDNPNITDAQQMQALGISAPMPEDQCAAINRVGMTQIFEEAQQAGEWNYDNPLYGVALIAAAGIAGGAYSGVDAIAEASNGVLTGGAGDTVLAGGTGAAEASSTGMSSLIDSARTAIKTIVSPAASAPITDKLIASAIKSAVSQLLFTGKVTPEGLAVGMATSFAQGALKDAFVTGLKDVVTDATIRESAAWLGSNAVVQLAATGDYSITSALKSAATGYISGKIWDVVTGEYRDPTDAERTTLSTFDTGDDTLQGTPAGDFFETYGIDPTEDLGFDPAIVDWEPVTPGSPEWYDQCLPFRQC